MENSSFWESTIVCLPAHLKEIDATDGKKLTQNGFIRAARLDWWDGGEATIDPDKKGNIKSAQRCVDETIVKNWEATDYGGNLKPQKRK